MTESQFAFTAVDEAAPFEDEDGGSKRNLLALGGLAAVVLAGGAYFLLSGGDAAEEEAFVVPSSPRVSESVAPAAVKPVKLPVATTVPLGRNPFRALYVAPAASGGGGGASTPVAPAAPVTPTTTTPTSGSPIVVVTPTSPSSAPAPTSTTAPAQPRPSFSTVTLSGVDAKTGVATFVYDGDRLTGKVGEVMGGKLKLISLQQDQTGRFFANLQLGDGSPFEVFEDQTVVVQ